MNVFWRQEILQGPKFARADALNMSTMLYHFEVRTRVDKNIQK